MFVVGLTGGIGSGKSTVAAEFQRLGIDVVDADLVARDVVAPDSQALQQIQDYFGDNVILADGSLDRAALRAAVFNNEQQRQWLNQLLHPLISQEMQVQLKAASSPYVLWVVPLLVENKLYQQADRVLVIDLPVEQQKLRAASRDRQSITQIEQVLASQASRQQRLAVADDVIDNSRPLSEVKRDVSTLHQRYLKLSQH
ncbi:dephospho-CoA kinase [Corallincola spongiicola]|uniref:Dephospho-CoA kinase n=1 Tax=Corallincola spongiicola TaxID=2520508 RepID=A0ABY1WNR8_9GAMM|nr:dephospho-CoA kinase [Corallincola spongiicola]TAA45122.1 dephospho-CoA kinase [Corallincola spongiicola]